MTIKFGNVGSGVSGSSAGDTGNFAFTWEHPVAWTQLRKYFEKSVGEEESKKLISILESNAKSLEDFLDAAYLKANGGNVFGRANFSGEVNVTGYINVPPPGVIVQWAGASTSVAPLGWLLANGDQVLISQYTNLYNILTNSGTTFPYGPNTNGSGGAGSTHFRLPNLAGRVPVGLDAGQTEFDTPGETGGAKTVTLDTTQIPSHQHGPGTLGTDTAGNHGHSVWSISANPASFNSPFGLGMTTATTSNADKITSTAGNHSHAVNTGSTAVEGGGLAHNNLQPYIVLNYIIKH